MNIEQIVKRFTYVIEKPNTYETLKGQSISKILLEEVWKEAQKELLEEMKTLDACQLESFIRNSLRALNK